MTIQAAADGSSLGNPGPAGWAWFVSEDCWDAGGWPSGTNNIGELTAVLELLLATEAAGMASEELHILTDSQYTINVITRWMAGWKKKGWRKADKKPIKNLELIQAIDKAISGRNVRFTWVKGHAGHTMNEIVDERARACALSYQRHQPIPSGPGFRGAHGSHHAVASVQSDFTAATDLQGSRRASASAQFGISQGSHADCVSSDATQLSSAYSGFTQPGRSDGSSALSAAEGTNHTSQNTRKHPMRQLKDDLQLDDLFSVLEDLDKESF